MKPYLVPALISLFVTGTMALAETAPHDSNTTDQNLPPILNWMMPVALFALIAYGVLRAQGKSLKKDDRHVQHMQRVEELLERIAVALERK
jgi:hypothetical protein